MRLICRYFRVQIIEDMLRYQLLADIPNQRPFLQYQYSTVPQKYAGIKTHSHPKPCGNMEFRVQRDWTPIARGSLHQPG